MYLFDIRVDTNIDGTGIRLTAEYSLRMAIAHLIARRDIMESDSAAIFDNGAGEKSH